MPAPHQFFQAGCPSCRPTNSVKALKAFGQHTHPFNGHFSGTTQVSRYQKGKTNLDFTEARDSEWQWHQLAYMQVCTSLQTDNHASTPPLSFLQAGCPSCRPTNSVKALKAFGQQLLPKTIKCNHFQSEPDKPIRLTAVQMRSKYAWYYVFKVPITKYLCHIHRHITSLYIPSQKKGNP